MAPIHTFIYLSVSRLEKKEGEILGERYKCRSLESQVCAIIISNFDGAVSIYSAL